SRRRHTRSKRDWSSDVCSSDLVKVAPRLAQPGGNFDRERFEAEVLAPLREGRDALYRPYDCHAGCLKEPVAAPCRPVVLAEGSYTCHPDLWPCYDLHVFVTAPLEVRLARLARQIGRAHV